jgi:hypothetical protein
MSFGPNAVFGISLRIAMPYQRGAAGRSTPTSLVPHETFSQLRGTLAAEAHAESFFVC